MTDTQSAATDIERCSIQDIGLVITGTAAPAMIATINSYLAVFAKPIVREGDLSIMFGRFECLQCGRPLGGACGSFQWGIANGEGTCSHCGYPCRAYHYPKDEDGNIFTQPLQFMLQYHPERIAEARDEADLAELQTENSAGS